MIDVNEIRKWHSVFYPQGGLFEIRLLGGKGRWKSASGYFTDVDTMIEQLEPILTQEYTYGSPSAYFTLNEIPEALYSREQHDKFVTGVSSTTDNDITRRKFVMMDFDPVRQAGISSSDAELAAAKTRMSKVYHFLKDLGFNEPVMAISGNGWHLQYSVDMPNDEEHTALVKEFIEAVARKFSDSKVDIDCKVFNAARICKLYGTEARKGANTTDRPWRLSEIKFVPQPLAVNNDSLFQKAISNLPPKPKKEVRSQSTGIYTGNSVAYVEKWLSEHGREYRVKEEGGCTYFQLRHCYWESSHTTKSADYNDAAICVASNGVISYYCRHAHCANKHWEDAKRVDDPNYVPYRDKYLAGSQQPIIIQQALRSKPQPDIKPEDDKRGKKWLSPLEIEKINLYDLPKVQTGFTELDKAIKGLHFFEYTILSGTNGCGKSSLLNTLLLNVIQRGTKVALWSGELPSFSLQTWIDMAAAGKHLQTGHDKEGMPYYYVSDEISHKIRAWLDGKLVIYNRNYGQKWEQLSNDIKELIDKGFRFFILDNLTSMDVDIIEGSQNEKEKTVVENLHDFCINNQCHIVLVVHPRKGTARGQRNLLRKDDVAGAGTITNLADNVFIFHRNNEDFRKGIAEFYGKDEASKYGIGGEYEKVGNVIEICKNRMFGNQDRLVRLYFDTMSRRFKNSPNEDIEYSWNESAVAKDGNFNFEKQDTDDNDMPFGRVTDEVPF